MEAIIGYLSGLHPMVPLVLAGLGSLVIVGQAYIVMSPTQKDDAWMVKVEKIPVVGHILKALKSFAPVQRKQPKK